MNLGEFFESADWPPPTPESRFTPAEVASLAREDRGPLPQLPPLWVLQAQHCASGRRWHDIYFYNSIRAAETGARRLGKDWWAARVVRYEATEVVAL